jgi:hypothetical protein
VLGYTETTDTGTTDTETTDTETYPPCPSCTSGAASSFAAPFADSEGPKLGSRLLMLTQHSYVGAANTSACSLANL